MPSFVRFADFLFACIRTCHYQQTNQHILLFGNFHRDKIYTLRLEIVFGFTGAMSKPKPKV